MKKVILFVILFTTLLLVGCSNNIDTDTTGTGVLDTDITEEMTTETTTEEEEPNREPDPVFKNTDSSFVLSFLPDTQMYTENNQIAKAFYSQMEWLVDHEEAYNIRFTSHLGDIVNRGYNLPQWKIADQAFKILDDASIPYGVTAGNHDFRGLTSDTSFYLWSDDERSTSEYYLKYFSQERTSQVTENYGGHSDNGWNSYYYFEGNGQQYMVLFVDYAPSDTTIQWVNQILEENKTIPTIIVTHILSKPIPTGARSTFSYPESVEFWENVIYENNQVFMAINGHHIGAGYEIKQNKFGNDVLLVIVDYQGDHNGGNGMMRLFEFDTENDTISSHSFSPYVLDIPKAERDFTLDKVELTDPRNKYDISWDFSDRFDFVNN